MDKIKKLKVVNRSLRTELDEDIYKILNKVNEIVDVMNSEYVGTESIIICEKCGKKIENWMTVYEADDCPHYFCAEHLLREEEIEKLLSRI